MLEKEYKYLISEEIYKELREKFSESKQRVIKNEYLLDTEGILEKNHVTVRVREEDSRKFFQIKQHIQSEKKFEKLTLREEYSREITDEKITTEEIKEEIKTFAQLNIKDIYSAGMLKTIRNQTDLGNKSVLCMDKNLYLDITDYEVEIEFQGKEPSESAKSIMKIMEEKSKQSQGGKRTRFLKRLRRTAE